MVNHSRWAVAGEAESVVQFVINKLIIISHKEDKSVSVYLKLYQVAAMWHASGPLLFIR